MAYTTNHTRLQKMREGNEESWEWFREFYSPLIVTRGRDYALSPEELTRLIQDVMLECFKGHILENYDKNKGLFRNYLRTVTSRCASRIIEDRNPQLVSVDEVDVPAEEDDKFTKEWREFILNKAYQELSETMDSTKYMAFQMHAVDGRPAAEVAEILGLTANQVYLISSRTTARLKDIVDRLSKELG